MPWLFLCRWGFFAPGGNAQLAQTASGIFQISRSKNVLKGFGRIAGLDVGPFDACQRKCVRRFDNRIVPQRVSLFILVGAVGKARPTLASLKRVLQKRARDAAAIPELAWALQPESRWISSVGSCRTRGSKTQRVAHSKTWRWTAWSSGGMMLPALAPRMYPFSIPMPATRQSGMKE